MRTTIRILLATAAVSLLHSALASRTAKKAAAQLIGERNRNAFYRPFYVAQSTATFGALVWYVLKLPDRVLWKASPRTALAFNTVRLASLAAMTAAVQQVGWRRMLGGQGLSDWRSGKPDIDPEPEAQGPRLTDRTPVTGPFRWSRHPLNFLGLPILWLAPRMTRNWFTFNVLATAYLFLGSRHEERRLRAAYGNRYAEYQKEASFFLGLPKPGTERGRHTFTPVQQAAPVLSPPPDCS